MTSTSAFPPAESLGAAVWVQALGCVQGGLVLGNQQGQPQPAVNSDSGLQSPSPPQSGSAPFAGPWGLASPSGGQAERPLQVSTSRAGKQALSTPSAPSHRSS